MSEELIQQLRERAENNARRANRLAARCNEVEAELAALKAGQGEAVAWEYQTFHDDNTVTPGWSAWERVDPRHSHETVAGMVAELQDYIARGYRYRLRALYTAPPATTDAVSVPRELLALAVSIPSMVSMQENTNDILRRGKAQAELHALLAQSQGVKP